MPRPASPSLVVMMLVLFAVQGCSRGGSGGPSGRGPRVVTVAVDTVRAHDIAREVTVSGAVEPIRRVLVSAQLAGTVVAVRVQEGDRVLAGAVLAELDARETAAQLARARALLAQAEAGYARARELRARQLVAESELEAARAADGVARAEADLWQTRFDLTRVVAPVAGVVTARAVERGAAVSAQQTLLELADDSELVVRLRVSERDVGALAIGAPVALQLDAHPGARVGGRIRRVFPSADPASRLVPVEVVFTAIPRGITVRPGYLARAAFAIERRDAVLAVPAAAVAAQDSAHWVYLVAADTLVRRRIEPGLTSGGWVEVREGLAGGEAVVRSGHLGLRPGLRVVLEGAPRGARAREQGRP